MVAISGWLSRTEVKKALLDSRVVVVMNKRHVKKPEDMITTMSAIHQAGFVGEVTLRIDPAIISGAMPELRRLRTEADPQHPFVLGVGSIIDNEGLEFASEQGFDMLVGPGNMVSQGTDPVKALRTIQNRHHLLAPAANSPFLAPAANSPSELQWLLTGEPGKGFIPDAIKIFPANVHGPKGLGALLAPFSRPKYADWIIMPTGGVDSKTGPEFAKAIAGAGFQPVLGMSDPLKLVEERNELGNPRLIADSLGAFIGRFLDNNGKQPFGAIK